MSPRDGKNDLVSPTLAFVVSFMPYEKKLIAEAITVHESAVDLSTQLYEGSEEFSLIFKLFNRWERTKASKNAFKGIAIDIIDLIEQSENKIEQPFSTQIRQRIYQSLLKSFGAPNNLHRCYSQIARARNPWIEHAILTAPDLVEFLQSVSFYIDEDDWVSWRSLAAMLTKLPIEMERWTTPASSLFGFEVWKVVRMYSLQNTRPEVGTALLEIWEAPSRKKYAELIWSEYCHEQDRQFMNCLKLVTSIFASESEPEDSDISEESWSEDEPPHESHKTTTLKFVDPNPMRTFLREILTYGHLELLTSQDILFVTRERLNASLRSENATEQFFLQLLTHVPDSCIKFGFLTETSQNSQNRRLFFSEPQVFQACQEKNDFPLFTPDNQKCILITSLPESLLELESSRFWERWNDCALVLVDDEILLVQTTLGWLFRKIAGDFTIDAAQEYLRRIINDPHGPHLRTILGESYDPKYELFIPFIDPTQFEMIEFLNRGANGSVLSAVWNRPDSASGTSATIRVAMKHPREELTRNDAQKRFLNEMEAVYRALSSMPSLCIQFYGITSLRLGNPIMDGLFLVFELATGGSIDNYLERLNNGNWDEVIGLFTDIANGLWDGLHTKTIAHGDLHQGNILITTRYYGADIITPEKKRAVLIDFGRGQWTRKSTSTGEQEVSRRRDNEAIRQDIHDYGCLIKDLAQQWMAWSGHTTIPTLLMDVIEACINGKNRTNMRAIVNMWDTYNPRTIAYIDAIQAWDSLSGLNESVYATTRSRPAAPSDRLAPKFISVENLD